MKIIYSYNKKNVLFGKFENLLNTVKSFSDIEIGLTKNNKVFFEEIIPFVNIAYTDDYVVGIQPYHTSSHSLSSFKNNQINYNNYSVIFLYYSNKNIAVLRSGFNLETIKSTFQASNYSCYKWYERTLSYNFKYNSSIDRYDTKKKNKLIDEIRKGSNLKIRFKLNEVNYILTPTIKYFNFDKDPNSLSIKTSPFIDISEIKKNKRFVLKECLININGDISILQSKEYFLTDKRNFFLRLFNFIFKKLTIDLYLSKKTILKNQNLQKQDIEWFLF